MIPINGFLGGVVGGPIAGVLSLTAGRYAYSRYQALTPAEKKKLYQDFLNSYPCRCIKAIISIFITIESEEDAVFNQLIVTTEERLEQITKNLVLPKKWLKKWLKN